MSPFVEISMGIGIFDDRVRSRSINAADFVISTYFRVAKCFLCEVAPDGMEIGIVDIALTDECSQEIGGDVLQNVELNIKSISN